MCLHVTPTKKMWVSFSKTDSGLFKDHYFLCSNLNFLYDSPWITFPYTVVSCLILPLCKFDYYVINNFVSITSFSIQLPIIYYRCYLFGHYGVVFCRSVLDFPLRSAFLTHVHLFLWEISSVCRLKYLYSCLSSYSCLLDIVVLFVFMLSVLFLVILISLS